MNVVKCLQLKYVTLFFDKILWIDWNYDHKGQLETCVIHIIGEDIMGTQVGLPNQICLDVNNGMVELRQFLDIISRFDGVAMKSEGIDR